MRITARLTLVSASVAAALGVLLPLLAWSFQEFSEARSSFHLAQQIKVGFLERTSFRDQYFLYREARMEAMWEHNRATAEGLLLQAQAQFRREQEREILARLRRDMDENAAIFRRIVGNSAMLEAAEDSRPAYEELHKRLASQLLLKAVAVHDAATALQEASGHRVEQAYRHLVVIVGLVSLLVAITTLMASTMIVRMIRRRLAPLHRGVRSIAEGDLGHRIGMQGSDEFSELSRDIDAMAMKLQTSTQQLGEEISQRLQVKAQQESEARFRAWFELPLAGACITSPEKGWLAVNDHLCQLLGYGREELLALTWADLTHPEDLTLDLVLFERVLRGESEGYSLEKRYLRKDGSSFLSDLGVGCVRKADGSVDYFVATIQDITERKAAEVALQARTLELAERIKALDCLYAISRAAEASGDDLEALLQATVDLLPAAWQHPSLACAQAVVDGQTFTTPNFRPCPWRQEKPILVQEVPVGTLEVGYLALPFPGEGPPFLAQEERLLEAVAQRLGKAVDRHRVQRVLRSRDELHRMLLHTAMDGFMQVDQQGRVLEVNESYCRMSGYTKEELLTLAVSDLEDAQTEAGVTDYIQRIMSAGELRFETRHRRKDGSLFDVEVSVQYKPEEGGRFVAFLRDITLRKSQEAERETVLGMLAMIQAPDRFQECLFKLTASLQAWSRCEAVGIRLREGEDFPYVETRGFPATFVQLENSLCARDPLGQIRTDGLGRPALECMCGNVICGRTDPSKSFFTPHGSFWSNCTTELLATTTDEDRQTRTRNRCNGEGYESVALIPLRVGGEAFGLLQFNDHRPGRFTAELIATFERIADGLAATLARRHTLEALRESEYFFRESQHAARTGSYTNDFVRGIWKSSEVLEQIFGIDSSYPRTLQGWMDLVHPEDRPMMDRHLAEEVFSGGRDFDKQYRIVRRADGDIRWVHGLGALQFDDRGNLTSMTGTIRDVTDEKQAEAAFLASEARLRATLDQMSEGAVILGFDWTYRYVNEVAADQERRPQESLLGRALLDLHPGFEQTETFRHYRSCMEDRISQAFEGERQFPDGSQGWYRFNVYPAVEGIFVLSLDISELKQGEEARHHLEGQIQKSLQLESLGRLAGGVAHDMNNVLAAILGMASANVEAQPEDSRPRKAFQTIISAAERGGKMVKALLNFARQSPAEEREMNLNELLQEEVQLLSHTTLAKVSLEVALAPDLRLISGDPSALSHAVMNLCVNAVDAMPDDGTLTLRTRNVDNDWVELEVEDTGCGMSPEVLERAMDPFFTTKGVGKGTGLGLSLVHSSVMAHRGQMDLQSQPGIGTTVRLRFPASQKQPVPMGLEPHPVKAALGVLRVLLVEDDELTQQGIQVILHALGHSQTTVPSGEEALALLRSGLDLEVVILDVNMPGLGGTGTLPRLRALRPTLPVILITGRVDQSAIALAEAHPGVRLLAKPFAMADLQRCLQKLLPG